MTHTFFLIVCGVCTLDEAMNTDNAKENMKNMAAAAGQAMRLYLAARSAILPEAKMKGNQCRKERGTGRQE